MKTFDLLFNEAGEVTSGGGGGEVSTSTTQPEPTGNEGGITPEGGETRIPGEGISTPEPSSNPYEAKFSAFADAEGNFNENTIEYLQSLGLKDTSAEMLARKGSVENIFKSLDHAQALIEKRDGVREYIPDPTNENEFNKWRDEKGIPRDPNDPENGYNFKSGLQEGESTVIPNDTLQEIGKMLHASNIPKEQANTLIETVNSALSGEINGKREEFEATSKAREQNAYNEFKAKHGVRAEEKERSLMQSAKAYDFDYDNEIDRMALTNPKVMQLMIDNAELSRTTGAMPDERSTPNLASSPRALAEQIMRDHPNGAWKRDSTLNDKVNALMRQASGAR